MDFIQDMEKPIDQILKESLSKAISYKAYRGLVESLANEGKSTGPIQTEDLSNYTKLNNKRMKRWDKVFKIDAATEEAIGRMDKKVTWLVLTESWCGDAAPALPVMEKIANLNPNIQLRIVMRDENTELMNEFLTNGGMSIPKLIAIEDASQSVVGSWGPRSKNAAKLVADHKAANNGKILPEFKQDLQMWYNKDKGSSILEELLTLK
jgi:thiol-disulfide isomerase/thioredoxin